MLTVFFFFTTFDPTILHTPDLCVPEPIQYTEEPKKVNGRRQIKQESLRKSLQGIYNEDIATTQKLPENKEHKMESTS